MKVAAICLVFLGVVAVGWAFQCYQCNTVTDGSGCGDPFDTSAQSRFRQACVLGSTCLKTNVGSSTARTCGVGNTCPAASSCEGDACVYCCEGDSCNSATTVAFNLVLVATMLGLARMFY